jgi:hypothetical protein
MHTPVAEKWLHGTSETPRSTAPEMSITLWIIGVLVSLIAVVIAALPLRRRESHPKLTVGFISGSWLIEHNAKHLRNRS